MLPVRTLEKNKHEVGENRTHETSFVGYIICRSAGVVWCGALRDDRVALMLAVTDQQVPRNMRGLQFFFLCFSYISSSSSLFSESSHGS